MPSASKGETQNIIIFHGLNWMKDDDQNVCRYCCRRMLLGHVDLIEKLLNYAPLEK